MAPKTVYELLTAETRSSNHLIVDDSLNSMRKVVALGVACMEQHGAPCRSGSLNPSEPNRSLLDRARWISGAIQDASLTNVPQESIDKLRLKIEGTLEAVVKECKRTFAETKTEQDLRAARARILGKEGSFTAVLKTMNEVPAQHKRDTGEKMNLTRQAIERAFDDRLHQIATTKHDTSDPGPK